MEKKALLVNFVRIRQKRFAEKAEFFIPFLQNALPNGRFLIVRNRIYRITRQPVVGLARAPLFRVQFNDQLFVDLFRDLLALGIFQKYALHFIRIELQPAEFAHVALGADGVLDDGQPL